MGSGNFGGAAIARVTVAPVGGGVGFQNGGGGGGGLHGVTRRTFMAEPNSVATQYFGSGGVRLPGGTSPSVAGPAGQGAYLGSAAAVR
jgi:hypothetical protein